MSWLDTSVKPMDIKKEVGKSYEGTYRGMKKIESKIGPQVIWLFTNDEGLTFGIYGFTMLNRAMESMQKGTLCRITYHGTEPMQTKFGLKDVHTVGVEVWTDEEKAQGEEFA